MPTRPRPAVAAFLAILGGLAAFHLWLNRVGLPDPALDLLAANLVLVLEPSMAGAAGFWAARRVEGRLRTMWALVGAGCVSWAAGQAAWTLYEATGTAVPFPSWADVGYLGLPLLVGAGLLHAALPEDRPGLRRVATLDLFIFASALLFISWSTALGPIFASYAQGQGVPLLERVIAVAYPISDLLLAGLALWLLPRGDHALRRPLLLLTGGLVLFTVADSAFALLTSQDAYQTGHVIDLGWAFGFLSIGLAGLDEAADVPRARRHLKISRRAVTMLPYAPVAIGMAVAGATAVREDALPIALFWLALVVVALVVVRQIVVLTENERLAREVEQAYARLQELQRAQLQVVNNVAHDIRSPLSVLPVQLHLLRATDGLTPVQRQSLDVIERATRRVDRLARDFQEVAKLESGQLALDLSTVDLQALLHDVLEEVRPVAEQRGVHVQAKSAETLPALVADGDRLIEVLYNLLSNAIKFTPAGGRVVLAAERVGDAVRVSVGDSGRGLDPAEIKRLFHPFTRIERPDEPRQKGTGLGLYIARGFVERHGGRIWAESDGHGRGSRFVVELPAHGPARPPAAPTASDDAPG